MLRKCTRYIFLLLFISVIALCCVFITDTKGSVKNFTQTAAYVDVENVEDNLMTAPTSDSGYTISTYDVKINVAENNVLSITETISCVFTTPSHGIYREIPLINKVKRTDGSKHTYFTKVTNITVNNIYKKSKSREKLTLKIGDANKYVTGNQTYVISYDYHLGKDGTNKYDELYFNIIGDKWTTSINKVTFTITMPKEFDESLIGFSSGYKGSTTSNVTHYTDDNVIYGETTSVLLAGQALTIRLELPNGYFVGVKSTISKSILILSYVIPAVFLVVVLIIFFYSCNKNRYIQTVEFYPPKDLNSLDVALIYKAKVSNKDVVSLIVCLADKGYLKIEEEIKGSIKLVRLNEDYSRLNAQEKQLMEAIFDSGEKVSLDSLKNASFSSKISKITQNVNDKENREVYVQTKLMILKNLMPILAILTPICSTLVLLLDFLIVIWLFPIVGFTLLRFSYKQKFMWLFAMFWGGIPFGVLIYYVCLYGSMYTLALIMGIVLGLGIYMLSRKTAFRTDEGGKLYAQIMGFKHFIKTAEKDRLEALCDDNPSYFYDILPYAYVLNVSNVWIKKFENIALANPQWYEGKYYDHVSIFSVTNSLTTYSSMSYGGGSSGGGSSGGGFSGGGSGGGGGGRW